MNDYLIFSDTHFQKHSDITLVKALVNLIKNSQNIIILGDFWDKYFTTFDEFLSNPRYSELFKALKEKNTIYIYGNHDPIELMDERVNKFCKECKQFHVLEIGGKTIHFEHGDQLAGVYPTRGILKLIDDFRTNVLKLNDVKVAHIDGFIFSIFERFTNGRNLFGNNWNNTIIRKCGAGNYVGKLLVCGHTHYYCNYDNYINSGANMYGFLQYINIKDSKIIPVQTNYQRTLTYPF